VCVCVMQTNSINSKNVIMYGEFRLCDTGTTNTEESDNDDSLHYHCHHHASSLSSSSSSFTTTAGHWMMAAFDFENDCCDPGSSAIDDDADQPQLRYALQEQHEEDDQDDEQYDQHDEGKEEHLDYSSPPAAPLAFPTPTIHLAQKHHGADAVAYLDHHFNIVISDPDQTILIPQQGPQQQQHAYLFKKALTKSSFGSIHVCIVLKRRQQPTDTRGVDDCEEPPSHVEWVSTDQLVAVKVSSWALMLRGGRGGGGGIFTPLVPTPGAATMSTSPTSTTNTSTNMMHVGKKLANHEAAAMQHVGNYHPNVLGCIEVLRDATNLYTVLPYCPGGDLYRKILGTSGGATTTFAKAAAKNCTTVQTNLPSEDQVRIWFRQLLAGLAHLQKKGVCHAALSLENLLLDQDNNLVIADLGMALRVPYSSPLDDHYHYHEQHHLSSCGFVDVSDGSGLRRLIQPQQQQSSTCKSSSGRRYMAPEVLANNQGFDGYAVDLWSAGVILFVMLVGTAPFRRAVESDSKFVQVACQGKLKRVLLAKSAASYLHHHHEVSAEAIDLLQNMLRADPRHRLSLADVMAHPWVVQECSTLDDNDTMHSPSHRFVLAKRAVVHFDPSVERSKDDNGTTKNIMQPPLIVAPIPKSLYPSKTRRRKNSLLQPLGEHHFEV
jgi:serine/threonine protein kinase